MSQGQSHGIIADLALMVTGMGASVAKMGLVIDRIEVRSDVMRDLEHALMEMTANGLIYNNEGRDPDRPMRLAGTLLVEIPRQDAPRVAIVLDMKYDPPPAPTMFR